MPPAFQLPPLKQTLQQVLAVQAMLAVLLIVVVVLASTLWSDSTAVGALTLARIKAILFGSVLGSLATVITARSVLKCSRAIARRNATGAEPSAYLEMLPLYSGMMLKILLIVGSIFGGLKYLQLAPLYVVLGYTTMQVGFIIGRDRI